MDYSQIYLIDYGLPILGLIITFLAQLYITSNYSKYKKIPNQSNKKGCEVAREILDKNGLQEIKILKTDGNLTDHYDPTKKVIKLSEDIYEGNTIASVSVAAHECGHAIQDKIGYTPLKIRAALVPMVNFSTKIGYIVVMIGLIFNALNIATIGLVLLLGMLLFQLITLPVEFNASTRAKNELAELHILTVEEQNGTKKMLTSAALTYVASVLTTLLQILRLALIVFARRDD